MKIPQRTQALLSWLNDAALLNLAGERAYQRGKAYFKDGRVASLVESPAGRVTAKVEGTEVYLVRLSADKTGLDFECDCPVGMDRAFCKHSVAVALAFRDDSEMGGRDEAAEIQRWLTGRPKEELVELLMDQIAKDDDLREELAAQAAEASGTALDLPTIRKQIRDATPTRGYIDYRTMPSVAARLRRAVGLVERLLGAGRASETIEIAEYALGRIVELTCNSDDSDGHMGGILAQLEDLHLEACEATKPDPVELAGRLFRWEAEGKLDLFHGAASTYADVLGAKGLEEYRRLAEEMLATRPVLGPKDKYSEERYCQSRLLRILEAYAKESGNVDELLAIKQRDLSSADRYLEIAAICDKAGRSDDALEWAEKGWKAFSERLDRSLGEFLAELYHARTRPKDAVAIMWQIFAAAPSLENYKLLKGHADRAGTWPEWSPRAQEQARKPQAFWGPRIVDILLWEGNSDAAWEEAQKGKHGEETLGWLAAARAADHPDQAACVYKLMIEEALRRADFANYERAIELLGLLRPVMERSAGPEACNGFVSGLREANKRRPRFLELLAAAKWK